MKEKQNPLSLEDSNVQFYDFDSEEDIEDVEVLISKGIALYEKAPNLNYKEALKKFEKAKELDQEKQFIHYCHYYTAMVYTKLAENVEDIAQKRQYYKIVADSFISFKNSIHGSREIQDSLGIKDINITIGEAFDKAGDLEKALNFFRNSEAYKRVEEIEQELNNSNNSPVLLRGSYLYNSQLIPVNNSDSHDIREIRQELNAVISIVAKHDQEIKEIKLTIADIKKILLSANIPLTADINDLIIGLEDINPKLQEYYKCFNIALHNVFVAASAVSSGLVVPDAGHLERVGPISAMKWLCYLGDIAAAGFLGPIITAVIAVLHDAGDNMFNSKEEVKLVDVLTKFCKMINKQSDMTVPIGQDLQRLALFFAYLRSAEIEKINKADTQNSFSDFSNFFDAKLPMQSKFFRHDTNDTKKMNSKPMAKLAFQDAISLISYMYHNAEDILKSSQPFLNKILTTVEERFHKSWDDIKKTTPGNVEYDLWQIEKQLPESEIITEKAKTGQLTSINIPYFSVDFSKSYFPIISLSGIRRGIEVFFNKEYSKDKLTTEEQGCFFLFLAYKIFRYGNEACLKYFGDNDKYKELIKQVLKDYPHLFFREEAINVCIKNEADRKKALDAIKLESSDKFFEDCFQKVFPNLNFVKVMVKLELKPKLEHGPVFESDPIEVLLLDIDENDVITIVGDVNIKQ